MFSATNAAFEGFRLAGRHPFLMLFWAVAYTVGIAILLAAMLLIVLPADIWRGLLAGNAEGLRDPDFNPIMFAVAFPLFFAAILLLTAMANTAIFRAILRPKPRGFGYLAIGGDEGRQILLSLLIMLVSVLFGIGLVVLAPTGLALTPEPYRVLAGVLGGIALFVLLIWVSTRLSLAAVQTFVERRVTLFGSWKLTRGRFWPLLGMWLLAFVLAIIVSLVATAVSYLPGFVAGAPLPSFGFETLRRVQAMPVETAVIVAVVLQGLIQMVGTIIQVVVGAAPGAAAYAQLKGPTA